MKSVNTGFTLIELMVVFAIIGILVSVGVGMMGSGLIDGTRCKHGLLFSIDMNGNEQQMFGPNGPMECGE